MIIAAEGTQFSTIQTCVLISDFIENGVEFLRTDEIWHSNIPAFIILPLW